MTSVSVSIFQFEQSFYLSAIKEDNRDLQSDEAVFNLAKTFQQFHYDGLTTYERFSEKYSLEGWMGRKVYAIPAGLYNATVEIYVPILIGIFVLPIFLIRGEEGDFVRVAKHLLFHEARQVQLGFGWLAVLLNDKYGLYHIQEANFHLTCYKCWVYKHAMFVSSETNPERGTIFA
jgi:hypothetical protein